MRITRLGQGVDATGRLDPDAIARCVAVLAEYRQVMDRLGVGRGRLAATSAARDAANGADFLTAAGEATGLAARAADRHRRGAAVPGRRGGRPRPGRRPVPGPRHRGRLHRAGGRRRTRRPRSGRGVAAARLRPPERAVPRLDDPPTPARAGRRPGRGGRPARPGRRRPSALRRVPPAGGSGRHGLHAGVGPPGTGRLRPGPRAPRRAHRGRRASLVRGRWPPTPWPGPARRVRAWCPDART